MKSQENRHRHSSAAAHSSGKKGSVAFPAPVQRYSEKTWKNKDCRVSDNEKMAVELNFGARFYAKSDVTLAPNVVVKGDALDDFHSYTVNAPHVKDCGQFAINIWKKISAMDTEKQVSERKVHNVEDGPKLISDYKTDFKKTLTGPATPGVGEAYYAVNNYDSDKEKIDDRSHYNFHWAVVVAKSGNDVVTAEADPNRGAMWFQMYSQSDADQTFKKHYVSKDKMHESMKVFTASFSLKEKPKEIEVINLDSDSD